MVSCVMMYVPDSTVDLFYELTTKDGVQAVLINERCEHPQRD
jgi:hypothetical protein